MSSRFLLGTIALISVFGLSACGSVSAPQTPTTTPPQQQPLSLEDAREIRSQVEELITINSQTNPVVAVIFNAEDLRKEQNFYKDAKDGDVLLIYPDVAKAVIYDPKADKLVNVGPVVVDGKNTAPEATAPATKKAPLPAAKAPTTTAPKTPTTNTPAQ